MEQATHGELLLACPDCRRVVVLAYHPAHVAQGMTNLDEHRQCFGCSQAMVETSRDKQGLVLCPEPAKRGARRGTS